MTARFHGRDAYSLLSFFMDLVFDFPFFDVAQILANEVLGVRRILLDLRPFLR